MIIEVVILIAAGGVITVVSIHVSMWVGARLSFAVVYSSVSTADVLYWYHNVFVYRWL